jgi:Na+-driven multidrug efflux pump
MSPADGGSGVGAPMAAALVPPPSLRELLRRILALAAPTSANAALQAVAQIAETWLAARQGTAALAGWAVALPFVLLMQQMSVGAMGGGVVSATARALGAGRRDEASALVLHALLIATGAGLVFAVALAVFPRAILGAIAGPEAAAAAAGYAIWLFGLGAVPAWVANTLASVLRGGRRHALAARVLGLVWIVHPVLSWLLMEPLGMGLAGAGAAFAALFWASAVAMAVVVLRGGACFTPRLRVRPQAMLFRRILAVGLVASALSAVSNLTTILVTAQVAAYGAAAVAAYGISARLEFLMIPLAFGVGSALTALVGRAVGAGDWATARRTAWAGGLLALAVAGGAGVAVGLAPATFAGFFTGDAAVVEVATRALAIIGPAYGGFGMGMALYFAALGAARVRWLVVASLSRLGLAVGAGALLAQGFGLGLEGHFLGVALGITAYGLVTASSVRPGVWPGCR